MNEVSLSKQDEITFFFAQLEAQWEVLFVTTMSHDNDGSLWAFTYFA